MNFRLELKQKEEEFDKLKTRWNEMQLAEEIPKKVILYYEEQVERLLSEIIHLQSLVHN